MALVVALQIGFVIAALWRTALAIASLRPLPSPPRPSRWPRYTILAALHDEAAMVPQLIRNLSQIDYPRRQLEGFLVLEAGDRATLDAAQATPRPNWLRIIVVPAGSPQTKPRALNHALSSATGEFVTIYDAEDSPDPGQLREAAARFAENSKLGCLQAPLRIRRGGAGLTRFLDRQFAFEYAALFEVNLPGMARLNLPFPLGGTSNHLRTAALRATDGWDAHNVTEDADLGFKLWSAGWRLGVLNSPTWETPPGGLERWLPQRTRWLKGYMQTWGVHTRTPLALGRRGMLAMVMTLGAAIVSAACHAPTLAWIISALMVGLHAGMAPDTPLASFAVLAVGVIAAWMGCAVGARRAGLDYRLTDMLAAPAYWSLLSLAFVHAFWRLIVAPYAWDKTAHDAEEDVKCAPDITVDAGREAA
ncbi:glycosyltransferase [Brevundimonas sp. SL130]|uniref:glycosyltransferase n=1 Tax=Brevundimonas sp. SL130 TaxID=2995143 RepID=UPI00226C9D8F|nr:glycosyltransferase [Brevundimonas sp. SL130]WAC58344.1 glycosyltransferase [Brevundimonas sp. SL130]